MNNGTTKQITFLICQINVSKITRFVDSSESAMEIHLVSIKVRIFSLVYI